MKKFFIVLLVLITLGGAGFAGWYFLLREKPLTIEFYGDFETLSYLSGDGSYKENEIVTLTADEREGYDFESWIKDGNPISSSRIYSFVMSKNTSGKYTATYKAKEFTISTQNNGVYNISNKAATDEMVDININPPKGYDVEEVYYVIDGSDEKVVIHNNRFKMPPHHISIFINLKEIKYEIKYDLGGGSFETTTISYYTINTPTFTLPHPTQKGYNFIGYMDKQSTAPILNYQIEQGSTKEISVWAEWELAFFDINTVVEGQGSITIGGNAQYQSNEHCGAVAEEGWQLTELYYIASETGDRVDLVDGYFTMPYYDITVYAIFEKIAYNITVSPSVINGYIEPTQTTSYVGDTVTIVAHPDTGCEVLLYQYSIDNEENWIDIEGNTFIMPASDVVIYAFFDAIDYQITYNLDGGTLPQDTLTTYRIWDSEVTLPTPTKEGFYFVGWYDNQDFNGEIITKFDAYDLENKTFYAYFQPNQYSVAFYNYDGTLLSTILGPWYYGGIPYNWGEAPTKPSTLEYDFVFAGWTPEIVPVVEDASYTAVFTAVPRVYTITKADNITKGNIECVTQSVHSETVIVTATPDLGAELIKTYYIKAGDSVENKVEFTNSFVMPKSNVTIYAEFDLINYDITYNLDGGTLPNGSAISYTIEDTVTLPSPTKTGYDFVGWIINDGDTPNKNITIAKGSTGAKEFTAVWQKQTFTIVWVNDDGITIETDANVPYGTTPSFDGETPSKAPTAEYEYSFAGWTPTITAATQNQTYTATYTQTARSYNIYTNLTNATVACKTTAKYGETINFTITVDDGYTLETVSYTCMFSMYTADINPSALTFTMPSEDVVINVSCLPNYYNITTECVATEGSISCLSGANCGEGVFVSTTAEEGYRLSRTYYIIEETETEITFREMFTMPAGNVTVYAEFERVYKVTSVGSDELEGSLGPDPFAEGELVEVDVYLTDTGLGGYLYGYYITAETYTRVEVFYEFISYGQLYKITFPMPAEDITLYTIFGNDAQTYVIKTNNPSNGAVSVQKTAETGEVVVVSTTPNNSYQLSRTYYIVEGTTTEVDFEGSFEMPAGNVTVYAEFDLADYNITYNLDGGTLPANAPVSYTIEDEVTLVYPTKTGYDFVGWIINDGDTPNKNITITKGSTGAKEFTAVWQIQAFTIVWVNDDVTTIETDANVPYGTTPSFDGETPSKAPTAEYEFIFAGWNPTVAVVTQHQTYTATYTSKARNYTITKATIANGNIICKESAAAGEMVDIFVNADDLSIYSVTDIYYIVEDSTDHIQISGTQFVMPAANITVYAVVEQTRFTITKASVSNGTISCVASAETGDTVTVYVNIDEGYRLSRTYYIVEGSTTKVDFEGSFTMPAGNVTVYAEFEKCYNIVVVEAANGSVEVPITAAAGEEITIIVTPDEGYEFSEGVINIDEDDSYQETRFTDTTFIYTMPEKNIIIQLFFTAKTYTITKTSTLGGSYSCSDNARTGSTVLVEATPDGSYKLEKAYYIEEGSTTKVNFEDSFVMPANNIKIYVKFQYAHLSGKLYDIAIGECTNGTIECQEQAYCDEIIDVTVIPDEGYQVSRIYYFYYVELELNLDNPLFSMPDKRVTLHAEFELIEKSYYIATAETSNGTITCPEFASEGDNVTLIAAPDSGYQLSRSYYIVEGTTTEVDFEGSFEMPAGNVTVYVVFVIAPYSINIAQTGSATVECVETAEAGTVVTPTITLRSGYEIDKMYYTLGDDETTKTAFRESFTMPNCDINLYVETYTTEAPDPTFSFNVFANDNNLGIAEIIAQNVREGLYTVEAIPYEGAEFVGWRQETIGGTLLSTDRVYVASNLDMGTIYAIFESNQETEERYTIKVVVGEEGTATYTGPTSAKAGEEVNFVVDNYEITGTYAVKIYYVTEDTNETVEIIEKTNPAYAKDIIFEMPAENITLYFDFIFSQNDPA